jgi:hypothetical protein
MGYQEDEAVSASEKLKALGGGFDRVTPIMRKTGPKMLGSEAYVHAKDIHAYVDALPQIVAVVEAAENPLTFKRLPILLAELEEALS